MVANLRSVLIIVLMIHVFLKYCGRRSITALVFMFTLILQVSESHAQVRDKTIYHQNGEVKEEGKLLDGERDGTWKVYHSDGVLSEKINYADGSKVNETRYNRQGNIVGKGDYTFSKKFFLETKFFSDGQLNSIKHKKIRNQRMSDSDHYGLYYKSSGVLYFFKYSHLFTHNDLPYSISIGFPTHNFYKTGTLSKVSYNKESMQWSPSGKIISTKEKSSADQQNFKEEEQLITNDQVLKQHNKEKNSTDQEHEYENGLIAPMKNWIPHGKWVNYHRDGSLWYEINFKNGLPEGDFHAYYSNGKLNTKSYFEEGLITGKFEMYYNNGQKKLEGYFNEGVRDSLWLCWNEDGAKIFESTYRDDKLHGKYIETNRDGSPWKEEAYLNGLKHGAFNSYNRNGGLYEKRHYEYNNQVGEYLKYYKSVLTQYYYQGSGLSLEFFNSGMVRSIQGGGSSARFLESGEIERFSYYGNKKSLQISVKDGVVEAIYKVNNEETQDIPYKFLKNKIKDILIQQIGDSVNGKRVGEWKTLYPNGSLWQKEHYNDDGLRDGELVLYDLEGQLREKSNYVNGLLEGLSEKYFNNGAPSVKEYYKSGLLNGKKSKWEEETGDFKSETDYLNGKEDGEKKLFRPTGEISAIYNYKNGRRDGTTRSYDENQNLEAIINHINGKKEGVYEKYNEDGKLILSVGYKNDKLNGNYMVYNKDGQKVERVYYYGEMISEKVDNEKVVETELICPCEAGYKDQSTFGYLPLLKHLTKYSEFMHSIDSTILVKEEDYNKLFYTSQPHTTYPDRTFAQVNVISFYDLSVNLPEFPGLDIILNPCLQRKKNVSKTNFDISYTYTLKRYDRDFDKRNFDYSSRAYFDLAMKVSGMDVDELYYHMALIMFDITMPESDDSKNEEILSFLHKYQLALDFDKIEYETMLDYLDTELTKFQDAIYEENLMVEDSVVSPNPDDHYDYKLVFDRFFSSRIGHNAWERLHLMLDFHLSVRTDMKQIALDFPTELFTSLDKLDTPKKVRLLIKTDKVNYDSNDGLLIGGVEEVCMEPVRLGESNIVMEFNSEIKIRKTAYSHPLGDSLFDKFLGANVETLGKRITIPISTGYVISKNEKKIPLTYKNIHVNGEMIAGMILMDDKYSKKVDLAAELKRFSEIYEVVQPKNAGGPITLHFYKSLLD